MRRLARSSFVAAAALLVGCAGGANADPKNALSNVADTWCPDGFEAGPNDTCFSVPETSTPDTPVLVYLHGVFEGRGAAEEWSAVRAAVARGFAVVIPRGKRGLCPWRSELKDHFCWPEDPEDTDAIAAVVGEWERVLWQVDALLERGVHERYVLGFEAGGSFAEHLALRGAFAARAYAVVDGHALTSAPKAGAGAPPILLVSATDDAARATKMRALRDDLSSAGWAHAWCTRSGGHALTPADVDAALRFFEHGLDGPLAPSGAAFTCEAPR